MTVAGWWTDQHVLLAAIRAANDYADVVAASPGWVGAPYLPALPLKATEYDDEGCPINCGFAARGLTTADSNRKLPYIEVFTNTGSAVTEWTDTEAALKDVTLNIRARVGYTGGLNGSNTNQQYALTLCRLAFNTIGAYLKVSALQLEPVGAFGICFVTNPMAPVIDLAPSLASAGTGTVTVDAIASYSVRQRQYFPSGYAAP